MENCTIWGHHGERRTEASNQEVIAPEVREDDDAHLVMMHDGTGDDVADRGGATNFLQPGQVKD
jgi:hypothetical protein